jgi:hypothetical protein
MFNPFNEHDLGRLRRSVSTTRKKWREHLTRRMSFMQQVAGYHYGPIGEATSDHVILPLLGLAMKIYSRLISSNNPQAHVSHWDPDYDPYCHELGLALNDEFERINLAGSLNAVTVESFFLAGVGKVGRVDEGATEEVGGYLHNVGGIFFDQVLNENFLFDMRSTKWEKIGYCGDETTVPVEWAQENKAYKKRARQLLQPDSEVSGGPLGGNFQRIKSQLLSTGGASPLNSDFDDQVTLLNLWFPQEQMMLVCDRNIEHVLSWREWEGPEHGPYHMLGYNYLPGNLVPLPPLAEWMDQHLAANQLANHVVNTSKKAKTISVVDAKDGGQDGDTVTNSEHGDVVRLNNPAGVSTLTFNGPDSAIWGLATMLKDSFYSTSGNLEAAGGLGPQSGTVGQDKLLSESVSRQVQEMQLDVTDMTQDVMVDIAWYMRNDPTWKRKLVKNVEGANMRIPFTAVPSELPGDWEEYRIKLEMYSRQNRTPQQRGQMLRETFKDLLAPLQPMLEPRGITIDFEKMLKKYAEYMDQPELADILIYTQGEQTRPAGPRSRMPTETTRKYVRENRPQTTRAGTDRVVAQMAFGGKPQPKEMANLAR